MVVTVWKDGTWKMWLPADAHYAAASDENWLVNIPVDEMLAERMLIHPKGVGGSAAALLSTDT